MWGEVMKITIREDLQIEVDEYGKFELPSTTYTAAELNKIAREVNRAIRKSRMEDMSYDSN